MGSRAVKLTTVIIEAVFDASETTIERCSFCPKEENKDPPFADWVVKRNGVQIGRCCPICTQKAKMHFMEAEMHGRAS